MKTKTHFTPKLLLLAVFSSLMFAIGLGGMGGCCGFDQGESTKPAHWEVTNENKDNVQISVSTADGVTVPVVKIFPNPFYPDIPGWAANAPGIGGLLFTASTSSLLVIYCSPDFGEIGSGMLVSMHESQFCSDEAPYYMKEPDCQETDSNKRSCTYLLEPTDIQVESYFCKSAYDEETREYLDEQCIGDHNPVFQVHIEMQIETEEKFISEKTYCEAVG